MYFIIIITIFDYKNNKYFFIFYNNIEFLYIDNYSFFQFLGYILLNYKIKLIIRR